ncbi:MAG TPA: glycoside hydrolase family 15 protein [Methylocella sp.]|nr:glycoside hydrolase family 15 protein [Methylocella sp.]
MPSAGAAENDERERTDEADLLAWGDRQAEISASSVLASISATHLVKDRPGFGQRVQPLPGSVLASTALANWDPDPDYFFHWQRDSAVVIDALRHLIEEGRFRAEALARFKDFLAFSLFLNALDGPAFLRAAGDFRQNVEPQYLQFVREDREIVALTGDRILGEPRFNPDATIDISKWSRPQHDGPAARALVLMRYWRLDSLDEESRRMMRRLIETDLAFILAHWHELSFDLWEEEKGEHYYTRLLHVAALEAGAAWFAETGGPVSALAAIRAAARESLATLDSFWDADKGFYVSRQNVEVPAPGKELDFAVILAILHSGRKAGAHSFCDPKVMATLARIEALFARIYKINWDRLPPHAPALGRYEGDHYFSGGAYYLSTLGAAEFYYALAKSLASGADFPETAENEMFRRGLDLRSEGQSPLERQRAWFSALLSRGDQFLATVKAYTPASGELSEQFDQTSGAQTSAKTLSWSHAAFLSAFAGRQAALCARDEAASGSDRDESA